MVIEWENNYQTRLSQNIMICQCLVDQLFASALGFGKYNWSACHWQITIFCSTSSNSCQLFVTSWLYLSRRYMHLYFDVHTINRFMPILISLTGHPLTLWEIQIINCDDNNYYYMQPPDPTCQRLKNCNVILSWKVTTTQTFTLVLSTCSLCLDCTGHL